MPKRVQMTRNKPWRHLYPDAVIVDRKYKWGNPFELGTRQGLARVPAVSYPGREWEYEGRISADGMRHDYHHPDGRITICHVRYMTRAEVVECFRALVTRSGWPLDWMAHTLYPTVEEIRAELAGKDLACWCKLSDLCHADVLLSIAAGGDS